MPKRGNWITQGIKVLRNWPLFTENRLNRHEGNTFESKIGASKVILKTCPKLLFLFFRNSLLHSFLIFFYLEWNKYLSDFPEVNILSLLPTLVIWPDITLGDQMRHNYFRVIQWPKVLYAPAVTGIRLPVTPTLVSPTGKNKAPRPNYYLIDRPFVFVFMSPWLLQ